jgi:hypothetical protein
MPILERRIQRQDWAEEMCHCNGIAKELGEANVKSAGAWDWALQEIIGLRELRDDWDGFGAEAPSEQVRESAIGLAHFLSKDGVDPPHRVAPGVCGSVIFEWQEPDGTYAIVEIDQPLHAEVMVIEPGKPARQWTLPSV